MDYHLYNGNRHYRWIRMKRNLLLDQLISFTDQIRTYEDICAFLSQVGLNNEQTENYISQLVDSQCLVSSMEPVATGKKPVTAQVAAATGMATDTNGCFASSLTETREVLATIPSAITDGSRGSLNKADHRREELGVGQERESRRGHG